MSNTTEIVKRPEGALSCECNESERYYEPRVDILESDEELLLLADLPGASADAVNIQFENGTLTIHGKVQPRQKEQAKVWVQEYGVGSFKRAFRIGQRLDASRFHAEFADGVLTLHLPKAESAKAKKITVQVKP